MSSRWESYGLCVFLTTLLLLAFSCSTQKKLSSLRKGEVTPVLSMANDTAYIPQLKNAKVTRDTLKVIDDEGREILFMKAFRNDEGEMVATEVLDAAVVTARFRNIAERFGKVDLAFQISVPSSMRDSRWQLRFYPDMYILGDSIRLEPVVITGQAYRKSQLKGYQQYERFLSKIVSDTTKFIDLRKLEIFLRRNIPQLYAFKNDSTEVSDEVFYSIYGVSEQEAVDHYTNKWAKRMNSRRKARMGEMYNKYVKMPIVTEGIRLDTVMVDKDGSFIYNYVQTINTRPRLRKVDIVLSGEIYDLDKCIYNIPRGAPLTFYISSLSTLADNRERFLQKVIERQAEANTACNIEFAQGKSIVDESLGHNREEMDRIKSIIADIMADERFDLDSILISAYASPEGTEANNQKLSKARSQAISRYFRQHLLAAQEEGFSVTEEGSIVHPETKDIHFLSRYVGENWNYLDHLVRNDTILTEKQKSDYALIGIIDNVDERERTLSKESYYRYLREHLYPKLRVVTFDFFMHRKGMIKDTVITTVPDTLYRMGMDALRDMDYHGALRILKDYNDYNTAVVYTALGLNHSALQILQEEERTPAVNHLLALIYSRMENYEKAVESYTRACKQDRSYVYRGNLDPEISALIKLYGLNKEEDDEFEY